MYKSINKELRTRIFSPRHQDREWVWLDGEMSDTTAYVKYRTHRKAFSGRNHRRKAIYSPPSMSPKYFMYFERWSPKSYLPRVERWYA